MNKEQIKDLIIFHLININIDENCKYVALDESGDIVGYDSRPIVVSNIWDYDGGKRDHEYYDLGDEMIAYENYGFDWKESLIKL